MCFLWHLGRRSNQPFLKEISLSVHWKDWCWSWNSNTLAIWYEELTHLKRPWCWERLKAGGEGHDKWDGWKASLTWWTWVWARPRSWWWTGKPGMLQSMGSQRVRHDWATELKELRMGLNKLVHCNSFLTNLLMSFKDLIGLNQKSCLLVVSLVIGEIIHVASWDECLHFSRVHWKEIVLPILGYF